MYNVHSPDRYLLNMYNVHSPDRHLLNMYKVHSPNKHLLNMYNVLTQNEIKCAPNDIMLKNVQILTFCIRKNKTKQKLPSAFTKKVVH